MTQQVNTPPVADVPAQTAPTPPVKKPFKKRKKRIKRIISTLVILAILAIGGFFLWKYLFAEEQTQGELLTDFAMVSSIQSMVEGSGSARAKDTAAITLTANGVVQEVFVSEGEFVTAGQPLYTIDSVSAQDDITAAQEGVEAAQEGVSTAMKGVEEAQEYVDELLEELDELNDSLNDLTVTAPFTGKLMDVKKFQTGESVSAGTTIATLVDDITLKMSLYFSYAYENDIYMGQDVQVSIPATMATYSGKVESIHKVSRIVPEGAVLFEVVVTMTNPGTLTADMEATASLTARDGSAVYPYENGKLEYYETRAVTTKLAGPMVSSNLFNYANVTAGQTLLVQGPDEQQKLIEAKEEEIENAREGVEAAQERVTAAQENVAIAMEKLNEAFSALDNFNAVAPIDGTVMSCTITPGQEVNANETVITISNTTSMTVEITVDDRNISYVQPGMMVDLSDYNGNIYMGLVTNIDMNPSMDGMMSGMTNYPITLAVDNYGGTLLSGQWLQYSFVASQSDSCIVIPIQSVKSTSDEEGNPISVVFLRAESRPENAVTMPEQSPDMPKTYPTEEDGFYAVPVTTGLSDTYHVEILEGLNEGDEVFTNYLTDSAYMYW